MIRPKSIHATFSLALAVFYLGFLIYILLYPFEFSASDSRPFFSFIIDSKGHIALVKNWSRLDLILNVVLFIPLGAFLFAWLERHVQSPVLALLATALGTGIVSATCEALQWFLPTRDSSITDLGTNVIGSVVGAAACWCWFLVARQLQGTRMPM